MSSYLSILKSYYIDRYLSLKVFNTLCIPLIIKGKKIFFLKQKAKCLPIRKDILEMITKKKLINIDKLNIDIAFQIA